MIDNLRDRFVADCRNWWRWGTTWLNAAGTTILTYALTNEHLVAQLIPIMPAAWRPYAPILGIAWGALVQIVRMMRQKPAGGNNGK